MKIEAFFNFGTKLCLTVGAPNSVLENFFYFITEITRNLVLKKGV